MLSDPSITITKHTLATSVGDRDNASAAPLVVPGLNCNSMLGRNLDNLRYQRANNPFV